VARNFEEFPFSLHRDALAFGWDLRKISEKEEKLRGLQTILMGCATLTL
jgi:hypothetical protein